MKSLITLTFFSAALFGCSEKPPLTTPPSQAALPAGLQSYFDAHCDDTSNLGIGFVAWHTYDYRFRQQLKRTQDPELKRLFVLENLHRFTEMALGNLEKGIVRTGQASSRPLTAAEWQAARQRILEQIEDLAKYTAFTNYAVSTHDPIDSPDPHLMFWVDELRQALGSITNMPAGRPQGGADSWEPSTSETNRTSVAAAPLALHDRWAGR